MNKKQSFTFIDLFNGIGGFRYGLESFGGKCVFSSDIDPLAQKVYQHNFGEDNCVGDITKINAWDIPSHDVLVGGFPCQAFSIAGNRQGFQNQTSGTLFFDVIRIAKHHQPKIIFLENVKGLVSHDQGRTISIIEFELEKIGYSVHYKVLRASDYGAVTIRPRIYIVAIRSDIDSGDFEFPSVSKTAKVLSDILDEEVDKSLVATTKQLRDLKKVPIKKNCDTRGTIRVATVGNGGQGERIYSDQGVAPTFGKNSGGRFPRVGAYQVDKIIRTLSINECKKIMGFPVSRLEIPKSVTTLQAYGLFGNSVAVPVIKAVFSKVIKYL